MTNEDIQEIIGSLSNSLGIEVQHNNANQNESTNDLTASNATINEVDTLPSINEGTSSSGTPLTFDAPSFPSIDEVLSEDTSFTEQTTPSEEDSAIPENPESEMVDERTSRFSGAPWFELIQQQVITVAGLGGIGSWTTLLLSRLHPRMICIYDDDIVEEGNMSGQLHDSNRIGQPKTSSMWDQCYRYSDYGNLSTHQRRFERTGVATPIMICGFDNMASRKDYFACWENFVESLPEEEKRKCLYIDGRLSAEAYQVLCITGDDRFNRDKYRNEYLFSDEEADATVCSYKQTSYMASMIGSMINNLVVNFVNNQIPNAIPRYLPFFTEYSGDTMYLKTTL